MSDKQMEKLPERGATGVGRKTQVRTVVSGVVADVRRLVGRLRERRRRTRGGARHPPARRGPSRSGAIRRGGRPFISAGWRRAMSVDDDDPELSAIPERLARGLTERERDVYRLLVRGHANRSIADALSPHSREVGVAVTSIFRQARELGPSDPETPE